MTAVVEQKHPEMALPQKRPLSFPRQNQESSYNHYSPLVTCRDPHGSLLSSLLLTIYMIPDLIIATLFF